MIFPPYLLLQSEFTTYHETT